MKQQVWFVTGASKGLGLSLVRTLLSAGHRVAATSRSASALNKAVGTHANFLALEMDLGSESSVRNAVENTIKKFGGLDVAVNNAGYGLMGAVEELSDKESRENFDVNVFGSLNVIRGVLPHMRANRKGHILNISSIGGYSGNFPGFGIYCATKFALAGLSEGLAADVAPFGVKVTVVYPGYFRTEFLNAESRVLPKSPIAEYANAKQVIDAHVNDIDNNQPGDPAKAAQAMIEVVASNEPPLHLFLGPDASGVADAKDAAVQKDRKAWMKTTLGTNL